MGLFSNDSVQPHQPPEPWDGSAMPSQAGKLAIVTGANSGIGYYTARALAAHGAHVILACRSEQRGRRAEKEMSQFLVDRELTTGRVEFMHLDLSSLASVKAFASAVHSKGFKALDLLINNAGLACPAQELTPDGFETQFQVNHLSHFYLTTLLFPLLRASPAARIVGVSSNAHRTVADMEFETLATGTDNSFTRYGRSKLANLLFTFELKQRLMDAGIHNVKAVIAHPGMTYSDMGDKFVEGVFPEATWGLCKWVLKVIPTQETEMGALPTLYVATVENVESGDYYGPADYMNSKGYPVKEIPEATCQSLEARKKLWEISEELTGVKFSVV